MIKKLYLFAMQSKKANNAKEKYRILENLNNYSNHHESTRIGFSASANIVHEAMILVNYSVANYFKMASLPYIYRNTILENSQEMESVKSFYSNVPDYHLGLKLDCYSHSTSPARRYADSFGQYIIHDFVFDNNVCAGNIYNWEELAKEISDYLNVRKKETEMFQNEYRILQKLKRK